MKMKAKIAVREIMKNQGIGVNALTALLQENVEGESFSSRKISERLSQDNMSIKVLNQMLKVLRYKIVLLPFDAKLPASGYEIE